MTSRAARPAVVATTAGSLALTALLLGCSPDVSVEEFCDTSDLSGGEHGSDPEAFSAVVDTLSDIEAPDEIAEDWETYVAGMTAFADAVEGVDPPSTGGDDAYVEARKGMMSAEFTEATARVEAFVDESCDT
jgi:hypothetical protein